MASSLIRINEATVEELQQLPSIGPKRAERIIRYREQVSPLVDHNDLAAAVGISEAKAREASHRIDWSRGTRTLPVNLLFSVCAGIACIFLYHYAVQGYDVAAAGPAPTLYFICILLIMLGALAIIFRQIMEGLPANIPGLDWVAIVSLTSGTLLLASLLVALWLSVIRDDFTSHVFATGELAVFVAVIILLIYGPGWHVRSRFRRFDTAATLFDHGQPVLAILTLVMLASQARPALIEILFGIWAGVSLLINSRELVLGHSSYVSNLSPREAARLASLMGQAPGEAPVVGNVRLRRPVGWVLAALSLALISEAIRVLAVDY